MPTAGHQSSSDSRGKRLWRWVADLADRVATRPPATSYRWAGTPSPVAATVFYGAFALRCLSLLQWIKFVFRGVADRRLRAGALSRRPDFHAAYTELYFITWLVFVAVWSEWRVGDPALRVLAIYLLAESFVWILYYLILRSLIEREYTLYHPAEYLLFLPVLIGYQVVLLHALLGGSYLDLFSSLSGNPPRTTWVWVAVACLSLIYLTIAVANLLTTYPGIKHRSPSNATVILGAGDVTAHRIVPALRAVWSGDPILVIGLEGPETDAYSAEIAKRATVRTVDKPSDALKIALAEMAPTIVASPTDQHFEQMLALAERGLLFAVEKPVATSPRHRSFIRDHIADVFSTCFTLSYYSLEKALPFTYLMSGIPEHAEFLSPDQGLAELPDERGVRALRHTLGELKAAEVRLLETDERSPTGGRTWKEHPAELYTLVETAIHPLMVVRYAIGASTVNWASITEGVYEPRAKQVASDGPIAPTYVHAIGATESGTSVSIEVGKYMPAGDRGCDLTFANGSVVCDFDARSLVARLNGRDPVAWRVKDPSAVPNYGVLMGLFRRFLSQGGWRASRFDDLPEQLDALDMWDSLCDQANALGATTVSYAGKGPAGSAAIKTRQGAAQLKPEPGTATATGGDPS